MLEFFIPFVISEPQSHRHTCILASVSITTYCVVAEKSHRILISRRLTSKASSRCYCAMQSFRSSDIMGENSTWCNAGRCAEDHVRMPDATVASRCISAATSHSPIAIAIAIVTTSSQYLPHHILCYMAPIRLLTPGTDTTLPTDSHATNAL